MKRTIKTLAVAFALLAGVSACTKETAGEEKGTGNLIVNFGFEQESRAAASTGVVPITTWTNNIKSMSLLLVQGGTIKDVRPIPNQSATDNAQISRTFTGVIAGTYDAYIVANYDQSGTPFGTGSVTPDPGIAGLKGTSISSFKLKLNNATGIVGSDPAGSTVYAEPSEIFIAKQSGVSVVADATTTHTSPFKLTRAVSLVRVRIDQTYDAASNDHNNSLVDFTTAGNANFRIRQHGNILDVASAANATAAPYGVNGAAATSVLYSAKAFKTAAEWNTLKTGYGTGADMKLDAADFTLWNDYMALPGGHASTGASKFNIVLGGKAPAGYKAIAANGTVTEIPTGGAMVYWTGQVTGAVPANGILELNIKLKTAGTTIVPEVGAYGTLKIDVDLVNWGTTTYAPLPL